jgi:hypothetical protein
MPGVAATSVRMRLRLARMLRLRRTVLSCHERNALHSAFGRRGLACGPLTTAAVAATILSARAARIIRMTWRMRVADLIVMPTAATMVLALLAVTLTVR